MVIVEFMGGLGNQMFQYAMGRSLSKHLNTTLKFDLNHLCGKIRLMNIKNIDQSELFLEVEIHNYHWRNKI